MKDYQSQSHVKWECKYHIVWCPKYRQKKLYGELRRRFGEIAHDLCRQKGVELIEGHAKPDHVHLCLSMPPKYSVSSIVGLYPIHTPHGIRKIRMHPLRKVTAE